MLSGRFFKYSSIVFLVLFGAACSKSVEGESTSSRTVILDKATQTILDQDIEYPSESDAQISASTVRIEPGAETGFHRHDAPLVAYILSGTLTVYYDGGVVKEYSPGTALVEAIGTYHNGRNEGTEPVEILAVSIGAEGIENTVARP